MITYHNGIIFDGTRFIEGCSVTVDQGIVVSVDKMGAVVGQEYDLAGGCLAPGFVDIQVNGGGGVMFDHQPSLSSLKTMVESHRQFGTTTLFPTLISSSWETMCAAQQVVKEAIKTKLPGIRGVHFEGPYLNVKKKGVHDPAVIRPVDAGAFDLFTEEGLGVVIVTLAPEQVSSSFIKKLAALGVRVCAGHTCADYEEMVKAFQDGVSGITHLFNAMSQFESRAPGVVGATIESEDVWCGIIVDGYHVHPAALRAVMQARPIEKILLVTDAMASVGTADKYFSLNGKDIVVEYGRCATGDGVLAGSDLDMAAAVRNAVSMLKVAPEEALRMASLYPAKFIGLDNRIGRIQPGYDADLVHLDEDFRVVRSFIATEG